MNAFERLSKLTTLVVDSGDIDSIMKYQPLDATTNPSLIFKAIALPTYSGFIHEALETCRVRKIPEENILSSACDCKHTRFSSTHFLRFPGFQPSDDTLLASGYSGIHGAAHCYIQLAIAQ